jgi:hypothetical protein
MTLRYFALILGIAFLLVGVLGFIPGMTHMHADAPNLAVEGPGHGYLLGLFHVNVLHNIVHLVFGVWGVAAYTSFSASRVYARSVAVIYGILAVMGLIPGLNTTFGLIPIHGHDVWLHALIALAAAYFGFTFAVATDDRRDTLTSPHGTSPHV